MKAAVCSSFLARWLPMDRARTSETRTDAVAREAASQDFNAARRGFFVVFGFAQPERRIVLKWSGPVHTHPSNIRPMPKLGHVPETLTVCQKVLRNAPPTAATTSANTTDATITLMRNTPPAIIPVARKGANRQPVSDFPARHSAVTTIKPTATSTITIVHLLPGA